MKEKLKRNVKFFDVGEVLMWICVWTNDDGRIWISVLENNSREHSYEGKGQTLIWLP